MISANGVVNEVEGVQMLQKIRKRKEDLRGRETLRARRAWKMM